MKKTNSYRIKRPLASNGGQSVIGVIVTVAISAVILDLLTSVFSFQNRETQNIANRIGIGDFQTTVGIALKDGTVCQYVLNNPAVKTFDLTALTPTTPQIITINTPIYASIDPGPPQVPGPIIAQINEAPSSYARNLKISSIQFVITSCSGNTCLANWQIGFDSTLMTRSTKPVSSSAIVNIDSTVPTAAKIAECMGVGSSDCWKVSAGKLQNTCSPSLDISAAVVTPLSAYLIGGKNAIAMPGSNNLVIGDTTPPSGVGKNNTVAGFGAGKAITSGESNAIFGTDAATNLTTGSSNVVFGARSATALTSGNRNVVIGAQGAQLLTSGADNVFVGYRAAKDISTGSQNVVVGANAAIGGSATSKNVIIGSEAAGALGIGLANVIIGYRASQSGGGVKNLVVGHRAAPNSTGVGNVILGMDAGSSLTTGSLNILIGNSVDVPLAAGDNALNIGNLIQGNLGSRRVAINMAPGAFTFQVNGSVAGNGAYQNISDSRLKENIEPITDALEKLDLITGVRFDWNQDVRPDLNLGKKREMGFLAQEVEKAFPEAVRRDHKGFLSIAYSKLIAPIFNGIRELKNQIFEIDERVIALKKENAELKNIICRRDALAPFCTKPAVGGSNEED